MRVRVPWETRGSEFAGAGGTGNRESQDYIDTVWDPGQPGVCKETLPQKINNRKKTNKHINK